MVKQLSIFDLDQEIYDDNDDFFGDPFDVFQSCLIIINQYFKIFGINKRVKKINDYILKRCLL